jgi:class 3 adenylate cyclase
VDLCGFTAFTERYGDEHTVVILASFRTTLREIAARRGVRITKWLGDGAMLSSSDTEATVAMVLEMAAHADTMLVMPARRAAPVLQPAGPGFDHSGFDHSGTDHAAHTSTPRRKADNADTRLAIRAGLARGPVIMFEGDDYIGRATNIASRLCDAAMPDQVLATREIAASAPRWVAASEPLPYPVRGFHEPIEAVRLATATSATMVTDPTCGLRLPEVSGLVARRGNDEQTVRFCSTACALAWEQAQRSPGAGSPFSA